MRYLKTFKNAEDIQVSLDNGLLGKPYIAKMENSDVLDFNTEDVTPYETRPLTMRIISGGTLFWSYQGNVTPKTIYYSKDFGETWTSWTSMERTDSANTGISVSTGDIIQFKGDNDTYSDANTGQSSSYQNNTGFFDSTALFDVYGNIMSLIDSQNFAGLVSFPANTHHNFAGLFAEGVSSSQEYGGVVDASNLILPATTLTIACYACLFYYNRHMIKGPDLPAATLLRNSYNAMFMGCYNLKYIKCLATDISAQGAVNNFSPNSAENIVSGSGIFVKAASMNNWKRTNGQIPWGWEVLNDDGSPAVQPVAYFARPVDDENPTGGQALQVQNGKVTGSYPAVSYMDTSNGFQLKVGTSIVYSSAITFDNVYLWGNVDCICGVYKDDGQGGYVIATKQDPLVVSGVSTIPMYCNCAYVYDFATNNLSAYTSDNNYRAQERCEAKGGAWDSQNRVCLDCEAQGLVSDGECGCTEPEE